MTGVTAVGVVVAPVIHLYELVEIVREAEVLAGDANNNCDLVRQATKRY